jgi:hypothetical protein
MKRQFCQVGTDQPMVISDMIVSNCLTWKALGRSRHAIQTDHELIIEAANGRLLQKTCLRSDELNASFRCQGLCASIGKIPAGTSFVFRWLPSV